MDTLKLIIIDDEILVRKLIRIKLKTEELNIEIVGEFSDGEMALNNIEYTKPDIVLSDICMPDMDGLSFSEACMQKYPDTKIILITGFNDFEYARKGLQVGVFDYLMKPVQTNDLNDTVKRAADIIRTNRESKQTENRILGEFRKNIQLLREDFLKKLLTGEKTLLKENRTYLEKELGITFAESEKNIIQVAVIRCSDLSGAKVKKLKKHIASFFTDDGYVYETFDENNQAIIIWNGAERIFESCIELLVQMIKDNEGCEVTSRISSVYDSATRIRDAYLEALSKFDDKNTEIETVTPKEETLEEKIDGILSEIAKNNIDWKIAREKALYMLSGLDVDFDFSKFSFCKCLWDVEHCLLHSKLQIHYKNAYERDKIKGKQFQEIYQYVSEHISDPALSANEIQSNFACSGSYLNRLLKAFCDMTYSDFVSEIKLWKMLELISTNRGLRDKDIGEQIGITDAHYLSIWFRKMTGYSVTEYRKLVELNE